MKFFVDIDNTICTTIKSDYLNSQPIHERIIKANDLYNQGHTIVYWTARGSESGIDHSQLTIKQLNDWGCKYHEILFNKPAYDLYIDDKSRAVDAYWPLTHSKCECVNSIPYTSTQNVKTDSRKQQSFKVLKGWGYEIIFANNSKYCGKILHFNTGSKFSMHYHLIKEESWYVASGKFLFKWIDTTNATIIEEYLQIGDIVTNEIGQPHQIICMEEGDIFEVSTQHFDSDSYRVFKGDSQK